MKTTANPHPLTTCVTGVLIGILALGPGCRPQDVPAPPTTEPKPEKAAPAPAAVKSAEPTTFTEVTARLDPGGNLYGYLGTAQWLSGLSDTLTSWQQVVLGLPGMSSSDQDEVRRVFGTVGRLVRNSGLESVTGVGVSGIALEPGYYQTKMFFHHPAGRGQGYLWTLFGGEPRAISELDWLPAQTAWATFADVDLAGVWAALRQETREIPELASAMDQAMRALRQEAGLDLEQMLGSLDGRVGLFLTLDPTNRFTLPLPAPEPLQIPTPALAVAFRVKNDALFEWIEGKLAENPGLASNVERSDEGGLRIRTVVLPGPLPLPLRPTLARFGDYLFLATTDGLVRELVEVKAGRRPGLRAAPEFVRLAQGMPSSANQFSFMSGGVGELVLKVQQTALGVAGREGEAALAVLQKLNQLSGSTASFSVAQNQPDGRWIISHGHQPPASALLLPLVVAPTAILAGMLLPALGNAKERAQSIQCVNNLKQIGLGARIYAMDNADTFPPDFRSMTNELVLPKVLFCPADPQANLSSDVTWGTLDLSRVSYEYVSPGLKEGQVEPGKVLFRCRIHKHVCLADGSVQQATQGR